MPKISKRVESSYFQESFKISETLQLALSQLVYISRKIASHAKIASPSNITNPWNISLPGKPQQIQVKVSLLCLEIQYISIEESSKFSPLTLRQFSYILICNNLFFWRVLKFMLHINAHILVQQRHLFKGILRKRPFSKCTEAVDCHKHLNLTCS